MKKDKIRIICKEPSKPAEWKTVPHTLEAFQDIVGSSTEAFAPFPMQMPDVLGLCNEDGKILGLTFNFLTERDIIAGPVVFVEVDGEEFTDVSEENGSKIIDMLFY